MADVLQQYDSDAERFVRIAREIIGVIQSPRTEHWWKDAEKLTWTLTEIWQQLPEVARIRSSDVLEHIGNESWDLRPDGIENCPPLLIVTRNAREDVADEIRPYFPVLLWDSGTAVSSMCCDPWMRIGRQVRELYHVRSDGTEKLFSGPESIAVKDVVFCLESWIRVVESMPTGNASELDLTGAIPVISEESTIRRTPSEVSYSPREYERVEAIVKANPGLKQRAIMAKLRADDEGGFRSVKLTAILRAMKS